MGRLTKTQREWLEWAASQGAGVSGITDKRTVNPLLHRGYASYDMYRDAWFITDAGRTALREATPEQGERG